MDKLKEFLASYRTSTKSGLAGLVVPAVTAAVVLVPFYDPISAYVAEACAQPKPLDFLVAGAAGWVVTWGTMYVAARKSKSPANPGVL